MGAVIIGKKLIPIKIINSSLNIIIIIVSLIPLNDFPRKKILEKGDFSYYFIKKNIIYPSIFQKKIFKLLLKTWLIFYKKSIKKLFKPISNSLKFSNPYFLSLNR